MNKLLKLGRFINRKLDKLSNGTKATLGAVFGSLAAINVGAFIAVMI